MFKLDKLFSVLFIPALIFSQNSFCDNPQFKGKLDMLATLINGSLGTIPGVGTAVCVPCTRGPCTKIATEANNAISIILTQTLENNKDLGKALEQLEKIWPLINDNLKSVISIGGSGYLGFGVGKSFDLVRVGNLSSDLIFPNGLAGGGARDLVQDLVSELEIFEAYVV